MDWEKEVCEAVDRILASENRREQLTLVDSLIEDIEDMVISAYIRGEQSGKKKLKERQ